tara:strand:+ start:2306 stop:3283 length:978 start_codon:yes stop_codon:yes gene_type:complete
MLEQAIIDAEALREAAMKNAEQAVIEKYSGEIKEAVESLLEQEDELGEFEEEGEEDVAKELDLADAGTDGENLCPCPEEEEEIELDLSALEKEIESALSGEEIGEPETQAALAADVMQEGEEDEEIEISLEEDEEDEDLGDLLEKLTFNYDPQPHGHIHLPTTAELEYADDVIKAKEAIEELEKAEKEKEKLTRRVKGLLETNKQLEEKIKNYKQKTTDLKEHISQVNISNAKLLYMNRVLGSTSLNERQKTKIVEALSKTDSVKEAKVIYETLQSSVGTSTKRGPKSLSEAVEKRSSLILTNRSEKKAQEDPTTNRWKRLAGIN